MIGRRAVSGGGDGVHGLIDIGTTKVCCVIVAADAGGSPGRILGIGYHRSRGIKAGVVADLDEAEAAVRGAVAQAERMAGLTLDRVHVACDCGRLASSRFSARIAVETGSVTDADIERLMSAARRYAERDGRVALQLVRLGCKIDGTAEVREPRGLAARKLVADIHAVTADDAPLRNLALLVERCHLSPEALVPAGLASALAVTTPDERRLGVAAVDIGGGTTSVALFADDGFTFTTTLPIGGNHVTYDLSRALQTPLAEAERIKALYGSLVRAPSDGQEVVAYTLATEGEPQLYQTSRAHVREVIEPRLGALMRQVDEALAMGGMRRGGNRRVVLTGGASQLVGLSEFAANALGCPVRIGRPNAWGGVPSSVSTPAFATVLGLPAALALQRGSVGGYRERDVLGAGYLGRVGQWLKASL